MYAKSGQFLFGLIGFIFSLMLLAALSKFWSPNSSDGHHWIWYAGIASLAVWQGYWGLREIKRSFINTPVLDNEDVTRLLFMAATCALACCWAIAMVTIWGYIITLEISVTAACIFIFALPFSLVSALLMMALLRMALEVVVDTFFY